MSDLAALRYIRKNKYAIRLYYTSSLGKKFMLFRKMMNTCKA